MVIITSGLGISSSYSIGEVRLLLFCHHHLYTRRCSSVFIPEDMMVD